MEPNKRQRLEVALKVRVVTAVLATKEFGEHFWKYLRAMRGVVRPIRLPDDDSPPRQ